MVSGHSMLPIMTTNKIHVSSGFKEVEVDFSLSVSSNRGIIRRLRENGLSDSLYFYFIVLDDDHAKEVLPFLNDKGKRSDVLEKIFTEDHKGILSSGAAKRFSFNQILENNLSIEYTETDMTNDYNNEFRTRVAIEYNPRRHYSDLRTENLHLVSFIHADIDPGSKTPPVGSALVYDLLLKRRGGMLTTPEFINIFYVNDVNYQRTEGSSVLGGSNLQPYSGPAHYHGPGGITPTSDGYVGWMAGQGPPEPMGPKLEVREVRNYKITSDLPFFEQRANECDSPECETTDASHLASAMIPESDLKIETRHNSLIKSASELRKDLTKFSKRYALVTPNILQYGSKSTAFTSLIQTETHRWPLAESHHGFAIGIDFLELVKYRSRLGYILEFHESRGNSDIISDCLKNSAILNLRIARRRVVSRPYHFNDQDTLKYTKYDKNEMDLEIISSADEKGTPRFKNKLFFSKLLKGEVREIELWTVGKTPTPSGENSVLPPPYSVRQFLVKDYDLFHNVDYGKYTYIVDLEVRDGIQIFLEEIFTRSSHTLSRYQNLVEMASIPLKATTFVEEGSSVESGNYNYITREFTESFKNDASNRIIIRDALAAYSYLRKLLTGDTGSRPDEDLAILEARLDPAVARMEDYLEFNKILLDLNRSVEKVLATGVSLSKGQSQNKQKSFVKNSTGGMSRSIKVSSKTGVLLEAFSDSNIAADYGLNLTSTSKTTYKYPADTSDSEEGSYDVTLPEGGEFEINNEDSNQGPGYQDYSPDLMLPEVREEGWGFDHDHERRYKNINQEISFDRYSKALVTSNTFRVRSEDKALAVLPKRFVRVVSSKFKTNYGFNTRKSGKRPFAREGKKNERAGQVDDISTVTDYYSASPNQKTHMDLKVGVLTKEKFSTSILDKKEESVYPFQSRKSYGGVSLGLARGGTTFGISESETKFWVLDSAIPDVADNIKKAICEAAFIAKDKEHFVTQVEGTYKELVVTRGLLGFVYDYIHKSLLFRKSAFGEGMYEQSYEEKYKEEFDAPKQSPEDLSGCYMKNARVLEVINPGSDPIPLTTLNMDTSRVTEGKNPKITRCLFVKYTSYNEPECALPVNDVVLLEI